MNKNQHKKQIGLLTFHYANNYGALLQTYATKTALEKLGHNVTVINLVKKHRNNFLSWINNQIINRNFANFREKYLAPFTKRIYIIDSPSELNNHFDTFIIGSDQVWRARFTSRLALNYFLDFADTDKLKISYASSFGISTWSETPELTPKILPLLKRFNHISVREKSGVDICKNVFGVPAVHVLDPCFLLDINDYNNIIGKKSKDYGKFIACFMLDKNDAFKKLSIYIKSYLDIKPINIKGNSFRALKIDIGFFKTIPEWLNYIKMSEFVVTDSFHCTLFALLFRKKFICLSNKRRGMARLQSLLSELGLIHFFIEDSTSINDIKIKEIIEHDIDWIDVQRTLDIRIKESKEFLVNALNNS